MQSFDLHHNNCWHETKRQYEAYWQKAFPLQPKGEQADKLLHIHRAALRMVKHFGLAKAPKDGCIVLMSMGNIIHHFGFYQNGLIHSLTEHGCYQLTEQQVHEKGLGKVKYLQTE